MLPLLQPQRTLRSCWPGLSLCRAVRRVHVCGHLFSFTDLVQGANKTAAMRQDQQNHGFTVSRDAEKVRKELCGMVIFGDGLQLLVCQK